MLICHVKPEFQFDIICFIYNLQDIHDAVAKFSNVSVTLHFSLIIVVFCIILRKENGCK